MSTNKSKKLVYLALLVAISSVLYFIELRIPTIVPIPGVKLGLANIITIYAMYTLGLKDVFLVMMTRILIGSLLSGNLFSLMYSFAGSFCVFTAMIYIRQIVPLQYIYVSSILSAIIHNIGQVALACLIMKSIGMISYLPVLIISGTIAGCITGIMALIIIQRVKKASNFIN